MPTNDESYKILHQHLINLHSIHETLKEGWQEYNLYFYIGGISAIIGGFFNVAGASALILTFIFFYYMGKFHRRIAKQKAEASGGSSGASTKS
jgi:hypothetical protein